MDKNAKLELLTVSELADKLAGSIDLDDVLRKDFPCCDFAIAVDVTPEHSDDLDYIKDASTGWYGINNIDAGFDSDELLLVADYYGGGFARLIVIDSDMPKDEANVKIRSGILSAMSCEIVSRDTKLICEWR